MPAWQRRGLAQYMYAQLLKAIATASPEAKPLVFIAPENEASKYLHRKTGFAPRATEQPSHHWVYLLQPEKTCPEKTC